MKKFLIIFSITIAIFLGISFFANSTYFFNKYIASNIKQYGFGYDKVEGALLSGFKVENLTYKKEPLSAEAELKFNPLKLIYKKISVNKLRLIAVNKNTLQKILNDFKPKEDSSSSTKISFDFEIKDILLTIKPFSFEGVRVKKNALSVNYIEYIGNKFNIGRVDYQAKTTIGNINFTGKYEHRILNIDTISLEKFNLKKFLPILKDASRNINSGNAQSSDFSIILIPKIVNVKDARLSLSPFRSKELFAKDLKVKISDAQFSVIDLVLKKASLNIDYLSDIASLNIDAKLENRNLNIKNLNFVLHKPNSFEKIYKEYFDTNSSGENIPVDILKLEKISLNKAFISAKDYKYKKEKISSVNFGLDGVIYDLNSSKFAVKDYNITLNSTLLTAKVNGLLNDKLVVKNAKLNTPNCDKLITIINSIIPKNSSKDSSSNNISIAPNNFIIEKLNANADTLSFEPFIINKTAVKAENIKGEFKKFKLHSGKLQVKVISNWGDANLNGTIKNNNYFASGKYKAAQKLLDEYSVPLIANHIEPLKINGRFGFKNLELNANLQGKDILKSAKDIDILFSNNKFTYDYSSGEILWTIDAKVNSVYSGKANLTNTLIYKNRLKYYGKLIPTQKLEFSKKFGKLFNALTLNYKGDSGKIDIDFTTQELKGFLKSNGYKGGELTIINRIPIKLSSIMNLGQGYKNATVDKLKIKAPIVYKKLLPLKGKMEIISNLVNIVGDWE